MIPRIFYFLALLLWISVSYSQDSQPPMAADSLVQNKVDSLVKYVRNQFYSNNLDKTISSGQTTLALAREIGDQKAVFAVSSLMGNAFLQLEDTIQAKRIFLKSIEEAQRTDDQVSKVTTLSDLGNLYTLQENNAKAIRQYEEALAIAKENDVSAHMFILNFNLAQSYLVLEDLDNASYYVRETYKHVDSTTAKPYRAVAKLNESKLNLLRKEARPAISNAKESIQLAEESGYNDPLIDGYSVYAQAEALEGNYDLAFNLMLKVDTLKTEKYKLDKLKTIENVTGKFKINEIQQELKAKTLQNEFNRQKEKRETTLLWVKIASAILLVSSIFVFISYLKRKKLLRDLRHKNKEYLAAKEASEISERSKTNLFANITHELRTPLYGIIGISSLLHEDKTLAHQASNLKSLRFSANHLLTLINNVLQFTKIETAKDQKPVLAPFRLKEVVQGSMDAVLFLNTTHPNQFDIHIDDKIPDVLEGDAVKLSQVLINLLGNAHKFTQNGTITIEVTQQTVTQADATLQFVIRDTGVGIPKEKQKNLFNEFSQVGYEDEYRGSGLGLTIVKKILDLYDSEITLQSEVGKGTEVSFQLTYAIAKEVPENTPSAHTKNRNVLEGKTILVVDDNKINLLVTKKNLERIGAQVHLASSGQEAIDMAQKEDFHLILMDINMPNMNGFVASENIRIHNPKVPILALTAVELEKVKDGNTEDLLQGYIIKPYDTDDFRTKILEHVL